MKAPPGVAAAQRSTARGAPRPQLLELGPAALACIASILEQTIHEAHIAPDVPTASHMGHDRHLRSTYHAAIEVQILTHGGVS